MLGSFITAALTKGYRVEGYTSANHMLRSVAGAEADMGCGGALAYGCSVGQGLTGISTWRSARSWRWPASWSVRSPACVAACAYRRLQPTSV